MGTSRTGDGPADRTPLLPSWALPGGGPPPLLPEDLPSDDLGGDDSDDGTPPANGADTAPGGTDQPDVVTPPAQAPPSPWQAAKGRFTRSARAGGGRSHVAASGRAYVRAKGGSRAAATSATHGRTTAGRASAFLGTLLNQGLRAALESLGIREYVGRSADVVFAAIANAIAPPGATLEEAAARRAADEMLAKLYDEVIEAGGDLNALEAMSPTAITDAVRDVITAYVYERWLEQLGKSIEAGATTPAEAVRLEREVKQYVRDIVALDISDADVLAFGRDPDRTQQVMSRLFEEAYDLLGEGQ